MKQVILTIALMLSLADTRIVSEDDGRKQRYSKPDLKPFVVEELC